MFPEPLSFSSYERAPLFDAVSSSTFWIIVVLLGLSIILIIDGCVVDRKTSDTNFKYLTEDNNYMFRRIDELENNILGKLNSRVSELENNYGKLLADLKKDIVPAPALALAPKKVLKIEEPVEDEEEEDEEE